MEKQQLELLKKEVLILKNNSTTESEIRDFLDENFDEKIESVDKSKPVIVYCKSGGRSAKCALKLAEKGFEKIYDLEGGFSQWKFKALSIED